MPQLLPFYIKHMILVGFLVLIILIYLISKYFLPRLNELYIARYKLSETYKKE
uniref:ATP synthase protein 8 n=1 Tax=Schizosaccharomyces japonicus (strain yFS275 / FY16936) TaxID=402676 RepID=Q8HMY8_SCHJY|nr:ATP synthase F0 subunit 8 [Schizosaccharomyces japonicus]AAN37921.1 ATP synthase F0 subunit 8 [Schizosaccharomyces japonicus]